MNGATQASQRGEVSRVSEIHLGAAIIDNLAVAFGDFSVFNLWGLQDQPALLVGMDVLGTLKELTIDYRLSTQRIAAATAPGVVQARGGDRVVSLAHTAAQLLARKSSPDF